MSVMPAPFGSCTPAHRTGRGWAGDRRMGSGDDLDGVCDRLERADGRSDRHLATEHGRLDRFQHREPVDEAFDAVSATDVQLGRRRWPGSPPGGGQRGRTCRTCWPASNRLRSPRRGTGTSDGQQRRRAQPRRAQPSGPIAIHVRERTGRRVVRGSSVVDRLQRACSVRRTSDGSGAGADRPSVATAGRWRTPADGACG